MKNSPTYSTLLITVALFLQCSTIRSEIPNNIASLRFEQPENIPAVLNGKDARMQLQLLAQSSSRGLVDVTRSCVYSVSGEDILQIDSLGFVQPINDGEVTITASIELPDGRTLDSHMQVAVTGFNDQRPINFSNQIVPIFTKHGCNGGGCHGKAAGQAGFKLSLLGFEPKEDYGHLVNESRGRRLFPAVPGKSLLLEKAVNLSPHGGGQRFGMDSHEYRLLERWIGGGMPFGSSTDPHVVEISVHPSERTLSTNSQQQLRVLAKYSDGSFEDITRRTQFESNNKDMANTNETGLVSLGNQAGDVAIMARYQGQVTVFRATVPLGIQVDQWPEKKNLVDEQVFAKLAKLGIPPSRVCDDSTFIRRVTLDLTGQLPTIRETQEYLTCTDQDKVEQLVDRLLSSSEHAEYFAKKWSAILRNRRPTAGHQYSSFAFFDWLRSSFKNNKPYDQFVRELIAATGSVETNPASAWLREVATTDSRVEDTAQLFLGQRLQCARCHHHPFEKWSQKNYYQMAAFFSTVAKKEGDRGEEPRFASRNASPTARDPRTGKAVVPTGLDGQAMEIPPFHNPRHALVDWMTKPDNPFFARSLVNRYWKHFFAVGMVEPEDDMRVTNPPSNSDLLNSLATFFIDSEFNQRALLKTICTSNTYQLEALANEYNLNDNNSYSRYYPKRLQAEVLLDAIDDVLETSTEFSGLPADTRSVCLPDTGFASYFLDVFGEPDSATACECERSGEATLAQSLHLLNSKEIQNKLRADDGRAARMANSKSKDTQLITELYLSAFARTPSDAEILTTTKFLQSKTKNSNEGEQLIAARREAFEDLIWALINSKEFLFNH